MASNDKAVRAKTPQDFMKAYESLSKEYGFMLNIVPVWVARDDGTWSTKLQVSVGELPEKQERISVRGQR